VTSQFDFDPLDLEYTTNHYISLDHEQQYTGSAGASYLWNDTRFSMDMLLGSGLRQDLDAPNGVPLANGMTTFNIPNGAHLPYYRQVNTGVSHTFKGIGFGPAKTGLTVRFDVINLFDTAYEIRNGTGIGVGAPQWGRAADFLEESLYPCTESSRTPTATEPVGQAPRRASQARMLAARRSSRYDVSWQQNVVPSSAGNPRRRKARALPHRLHARSANPPPARSSSARCIPR
jgi:hypothetical protein